MNAQNAAAEEKERVDSARAAVRAVASAFRSLRMYPLGHALATRALHGAQDVLAAHIAKYGPLIVSIPARGVILDPGARPYEDDLVDDLARALRARAVPALRFLPGLSADELGELLAALHRPVQQIERQGGLNKLLRERDVRNVLVGGGDLPPPPPEEQLDALLAPLGRGAVDEVAAALAAAALSAAGTSPDQVAGLLRDLDRRIATWSKADQEAARRILGHAVATAQASWQRQVGALVLASDEPWALSIAAHLTPTLAASLGSADFADRVRTLHRESPRAPLPPAPVLEADERAEARAAFEQWTAPALRAHALRRYVEMLPALDSRRLTDCLDELIERSVVHLVEEDDTAALRSVLRGLVEATRRVADVRADLLRAALLRMMTLGARDLMERIIAEPVAMDHPLVEAMQVAPAETVQALLELVGEEERIAVRRSVVEFLTTLASGRPELLAEHVVDPRWQIARNAVTVLGRLGGPDIMPYLRAAMEHDDGRVRRESMRALAEVGTVDAVEVLAGALYAGEPSARQTAAHWLGMIGLPEAVEALAALFERSSLGDDLDVKREAIRSLGRLGGPRAVETLRQVAGRDTSPMRRRVVDELRQEASAVLAQMRGEG